MATHLCLSISTGEKFSTHSAIEQKSLLEYSLNAATTFISWGYLFFLEYILLVIIIFCIMQALFALQFISNHINHSAF